jgi:hypothetical protein
MPSPRLTPGRQFCIAELQQSRPAELWLEKLAIGARQGRVAERLITPTSTPTRRWLLEIVD